MNSLEQFDKDLKLALKSGDRSRVSTLRMLLAEIKNKKIELGKDLSSDQIVEIVRKEAKKRKEAIEQYRRGSRDELAQKEEQELEILSKYLPAEVSDEELNKLVEAAIAEVGASSIADMGKVMGILMPKVAGKTDGGRVSQLVRKKLAHQD